MVPGQYAGGIGQDGLDNLREFVRAGGTLVALNRTASALIPLLSLPVENVIEGAKSSKFFCSGALVRVNTEHADLPANYGEPDSPVVMFQSGPVFEPLPGFHGAVLAEYSKQTNPLESGLLLHPEAIRGPCRGSGARIRPRAYRALRIQAAVPRPVPRHLQIPLQRALLVRSSGVAGGADRRSEER